MSTVEPTTPTTQEVESGGHLFLTIFAVIFALLAVLITVILNRLGPFIKYIVEKYGSKYIKTKITVESIDISLRQGTVEIRNIEVANPEGFSKSNIAKLDSLSVKFSPRVWKKPFTIHSVIVKGTNVTYEVNMSGTNVNALLAAMSPPKEAEKVKESEKAIENEKIAENDEKETPETEKTQIEEEKKDGEKPEAVPAFVIELVDITGTTVTLGMGGAVKIPIPIVPIQMKNVGASKVSSLIYDIVARICEAVISAATSSVSNVASATYNMAASAVSSTWNWFTGASSSSQKNDVNGEVPMNLANDVNDEVPMNPANDINDEVPMNLTSDVNDEVPMNLANDVSDEVPIQE